MADYTKKGQEGGLPHDYTAPDREVIYSGGLSFPLRCGGEYRVAVNVTQELGGCKASSIKRLYEHALKVADDYIDNVPCPDDCNVKDRWVIYRYWSCFDPELDIASSVATLGLIRGFKCIKPFMPKTKGLPSPARDDYSDLPHREPQRHDEASGVDVQIGEVIRSSLQPPCPCDKLVRVEYQLIVESCENLDFTNAVREAEAKARDYYDLLVCKKGCRKAPFSVILKSWDCNDDVAGVVVFFRVKCS